MREMFIPAPPGQRPATLEVIRQANEICAEYQAQGFNLTLRQVYYQFVARGLLDNSQRNYKRLGDILNDARLAGQMDWDYIQDRTRAIRGGFWGYDTPGQYIDSVAEGYYENLWADQPARPEVWVEKDALIDIVAGACARDRVPHFSCRGNVSQSEMYAAAKRIARRRSQGLEVVVIHLGDHDPNGIDMTRDIRDRLTLLSRGPVEVLRVALTMDQIEQYDPPPSPAKLSDSRGAAYVAEHGPYAWELDALEPTVMQQIITDALEPYIDREVMEEAREHEQAGEARIRTIAERWPDLEAQWDDVLDLIGAGE